MRDIIGKSEFRQHATTHTPVPRHRTPSFFDKVLGFLNTVIGAIASNDAPSELVLVSEDVVHAKPRKYRLKRLKLKRANLGYVRHKTKETGHTLREEFSKPGRKTAVVHSMALGALFAFAVSGFSWRTLTAPSSATTTTDSTGVRRYLPNIASVPASQELNPGKAVVASGQQIKLYGWITPWNVSNTSSDLYAGASAFWATVGTDGATITPRADWGAWQTYKKTHGLSETYLTVSGDPNDTYIALTDLGKQSQHIANLLKLVNEQSFTGVDIDYEGLGIDNRELYTAFIRNLSNIFHQQGKKVAVTLEARIANQVPMDWQALGQLADEVRIMAYDYHSHITDRPGPIAPLAWVAEIVSYASERIDPHKIVIGLGNYGYDWTAPDTDSGQWNGIGLSYDRAVSISTDEISPVVHRTGIDDRGYDIGTIPMFTYVDTQSRQHEVWFEDATSLQEKVNAVANYQIKGVVFWSVGAGDPTLLKGSN